MKKLPELFDNNRAWAEGKVAADPGFFRELSVQLFGWSCQPRGYQEGVYVSKERLLSAMWANVQHSQAQAGYPYR